MIFSKICDFQYVPSLLPFCWRNEAVGIYPGLWQVCLKFALIKHLVVLTALLTVVLVYFQYISALLLLHGGTQAARLHMYLWKVIRFCIFRSSQLKMQSLIVITLYVQILMSWNDSKCFQPRCFLLHTQQKGSRSYCPPSPAGPSGTTCVHQFSFKVNCRKIIGNSSFSTHIL